MADSRQRPIGNAVPGDFGDLVPAKRVGPLPMFNEWLNINRPDVPAGEVTASYTVDPSGKAEVLAVRASDGNGVREEVLSRAIVASTYEPAYVSTPYTDPATGATLPANSPVHSPPKNITVYWHSPSDSAPGTDYHWACDQETKVCSWKVRVTEKPSQGRVSAVTEVKEEEKPAPPKKRSFIPAIIVGGFAGWFIYGRTHRG